MTQNESLGKFLSHKRYHSYTVDNDNVLGWQLNYEGRNEYRALLHMQCALPFLKLSQKPCQ